MVDGGRGALPGIMVLGQLFLRQETGSCLPVLPERFFFFFLNPGCVLLLFPGPLCSP